MASIVTIYFTEPSVYYFLHPYVYQKIGNQWYSFLQYYNESSPLINGTFTRIECQNKGLIDATFNIVIKLTNATVSEKSLPPLQLVESTTYKLSHNLNSQEATYADVNFTVSDDAFGFVISMQFQTNQLLIVMM